jgi:hypothetical protein
MNIDVVGVNTDYERMIMEHENAVFLYCDTDDWLFSSDVYGFRKYRGKAFAIPVCTKEEGCFTCLNVYNKMIIDVAFNKLFSAIEHNPEIDTVYYLFDDASNYCIRVVHEHPFVDTSVVSYIMKKIFSISNRPVKIMVSSPFVIN